MKILGENYDERYGLDEYDEYDPFEGECNWDEDDVLDAIKDDVIATLGIEEFSDEWWQLMSI